MGHNHLSATGEWMLVIPYRDLFLDGHGHRPGSAYVEQVWLSALGPTATWLWTRLARVAAARPETVVDMVDRAASLGLGTQLGPNSMISRTISRPVHFDVVHRAGSILAVRTALPDLPAWPLERASASVRFAHQQLAKGTVQLPQPAVAEISNGVPCERIVGTDLGFSSGPGVRDGAMRR